MSLLTKTLLMRFEQLVSSASQIDIAVGWAGPSPALELLQTRAINRKVKVRIVVGLSGNGTNPEALRSLQEFADVRIGHAAPGIFHPKFYLFRSGRKSICWVGSANFTLGGFATNSELVNEFEDDGTAQRWFRDLWSSLTPNPAKEIDQYVKGWKRPPGRGPARSAPQPSATNDPLELLHSAPQSWAEYIAALRICDAHWHQRSSKGWERFSVLDPEWSWMETIAAGRDLLRRKDWASFTDEEVNVLLPFREGDGAWGLLGSMKPAATAVSVFLKNQANVRRIIHRSISKVINAADESEFVDAAERAISDIASLERFGPAVATRLIALARPDRGVAVNNGSAPGLAKLTKLPKTASVLASPENYRKLLRWVYQQPWYQVPEPDDSLERTVWSMRAALIDCFVYTPV
jgi:hypothetical protein